MSDELLVLICGQPRNINKTRFRVPISFEILNDVNEIEAHIDSGSPSTRFIVLLLDEPDELINSIVARLSNKLNVVATLMCKSPRNNLPDLRNVLQISKHLITYKTILYSIRAYQTISNQLYASNQKSLAAYFQNEAEKLFKWLRENINLLACHILIIPLNTNRGNLINCQQAEIDICKRFWRNKEIRVCILYDYILFEESDLNFFDPLDEADIRFRRELKNMVLNLIPHLAPIRFYLVGNEDTIPFEPSKILVAREQNTSSNGARKYIDQCTFIQYETIRNPQIINNLAGYLRTTFWQLDPFQTRAIRLDDIESDRTNFINAVESIHDTLSKREDDTKIAILMQNDNFREQNPDISDQLHSTGQPQTVPMDEDENSGASMFTRIQDDFGRSLQNE